jgi:hypothetical protein
MAEYYRWEMRQVTCPEEGCPAGLLLQWHYAGEAAPVLDGVECDHPRLKDLDNWECGWACWEKLAATSPQ